MSRGVTVKVKFTGFALLPALSVALKVIVFVLPISSLLVVIVILVTFSESVVLTLVLVALPEISLLPYFVVKSLPSIVTTLLSLAVTVKVTLSPSTTVWLLGDISNVGGCLSGASVGVTGLLRTEVTVPPLLTTVSAVIGFPGNAPLTVTVAVCPFVTPVPITVFPS